jgi:diacylglycerol O-acyltransferase
MERFMRESDAFSWYLESDPVLRSIVVAALWFESTPDWDDLHRRMERASRLVPVLRQRLVEVPARLAAPLWAGDPEFDLSWHLRRIYAPPPRTDEVVLDLARKEASTAFDRTRPLWQFTLIEGLEDGRAALVMKMHHSLTDGVGAMELAFALFDREAHPAPLGQMPGAPAGEETRPVSIIGEHLAYRVRQSARLSAEAARGVVPSARAVMHRPLTSTRSLLSLAASIGRTVEPVFDTKSPIMKRRGLGRHLSSLEFELGQLQAAARASGGTLNDVFVAGAAGGLRRYHERHGQLVGDLRLMMPINLRSPGDPAGGNRITLMRFKVPAGERDVRRRIAEVGRRCRAARRERSLPYTNAIAGGLNLLPPAVVGSIFKHVDFVASNVPSFPESVYLAGTRMVKEVAFGPTTGTAVNLTLLSYAGQCSIGVTADTAAVPDPALLLECIRDGFEEMLELGRGPAPSRGRPPRKATVGSKETRIPSTSAAGTST